MLWIRTIIATTTVTRARLNLNEYFMQKMKSSYIDAAQLLTQYFSSIYSGRTFSNSWINEKSDKMNEKNKKVDLQKWKWRRDLFVHQLVIVFFGEHGWQIVDVSNIYDDFRIIFVQTIWRHKCQLVLTNRFDFNPQKNHEKGEKRIEQKRTRE